MSTIKDYLNRRSMFSVFGVGFLALTVIAVTITLTIFQSLTSSQVDEEVYADTQIIANLSSDYVNHVMDLSNDIIENTAKAMNTMDEEYYNQLLEEVSANSSLFTLIEILDMDGYVIYSSNVESLGMGLNRAGDIPYKEIISGKHTVFTTSLNSLESGKAMTLAKEEGEFIFIGYINFSQLYETLTEYMMNQTRHFQMVITDEYGIYLAGSSHAYAEQRRRFEYFDEFQMKFVKEGNQFDVQINDERYIVSAERFEINDWYLFVYEGTETLSTRFYDNFMTPILIIFMVIVITGIGYFGLTRYLKKRIYEYIDTTEEIASGNYQVDMPKAFYKEFNTLSEHFDTMSKAIKDRNDDLYNIAYFDSLTTLVTRTKILEEFNKGYFNNAAFAYIDLNKFKSINDTYGHKIGDDVLSQLGKVLNYTFDRPNEMIARIGGDELLYVMFDYKSKEEVAERLKALQSIESICFETNEISMYLSFSVGVSYYPENGDNFEYLMSCADIAMYNLRLARKGQFFREYTEEMRLGFDRKTILSTDIIQAINASEFTVMYQPIMDVANNRIRGFEALSRWNHPMLGEIQPTEFIQILEDKELIHKLDMSVLVQASHDMELLREQYHQDLVLSVNFSAIHLSRADFFDIFLKTIEENKINTELLEIEITESALIDDFDYLKEIMGKMREIGVGVSEDDFGTGYSSLSYLLRLDLSTLKIPREFLMAYNESGKSSRIINSLVVLANELGLKVVIEGVEDEDQAALLKEIGVDYIQGFFYSRPLTIAQALEYIK